MKNKLFGLISLLIAYLFIEGFAYAAHHIKYGGHSLYDIQTSKLQAIKQLNQSAVFQPEAAIKKNVVVKPILHPYIGYYIDGKRKQEDCVPADIYDCVERIKVFTDLPLERRSPDKLIVGIVGGSFADGSTRGGTSEIYQKSLAQLAAFQNKEIILYNMAGGGYKQPQQLMHISYMYAMGAEFDIIINIDGFNDVAASFYGWNDYQLHPAFPVSWNSRVQSGMTEEQLELYLEKKQIASKHASYAKFWLLEGIRYSPAMNLVWNVVNNNYIIKKVDVESRLGRVFEEKPRDFLYESLGPDYQFAEWDGFLEYTIELWANSSRALHALAQGHGAKYFHFIQPNQYIEGSKILSEFEKENTVLPSGGYGNVYKKAHPALVEKAKKLQASGLPIFDFTYLFREESETLYIDNCCHLNGTGYDIVAKAIVAKIEEQIARDAQSAN